MIAIGEFAYTTGLTIKTLRYYDEIGLLPAAHVDEFSGYRSYSAAQIHHAALLRVLRAAGMSTSQMTQALTHPREIDDVLDQRRREIAAQRALEDWALDAARTWATPPDTDAVHTRECEELRWVGVQVGLDLKDLDGQDDAAAGDLLGETLMGHYEQLGGHLATHGHEAFWDDAFLTMSTRRAQPSVVHVQYCVPLARPLPADPGLEGIEVVSGVLPARTEAYLSIPLREDGTVDGEAPALLPGGALPARAAIALALVAEEAGAQSRVIRQRTVHAGTGSDAGQAWQAPTAVEVSLTLRVRE